MTLAGVPTLRSSAGFTLVETLMAAMLGVLVLFAAGLFMDTGFRTTREVSERADNAERAQTGLDRTIRALRSEVCARDSTGAPLAPVLYGSPTSVSFMGVPTGTGTPVRVVLSYDSATGALNESFYLDPFVGSPFRVTQLLNGVDTPSGTPMFAYYGVPSAGGGADQALTATPSLSDPDRGRVARVAVTLRAANPQSHNLSNAVTLTDSATLVNTVAASGSC